MSARGRDVRRLSLWWDTLPEELLGPPRPPLDGDHEADVAIVGGGFTGLWTAFYLLEHAPQLRVVVLEREVAGYGASGRNGGWCSALFPTSWEKLARRTSRERAVAMQRAMFATVDEIGRVVEAEGIDCRWAKGGTLHLARSAVQLARAEEEVARARAWGFGEEDYRLLGADETRSRAHARGVRGATFTPHCAAIHPARLVRSLAQAVERRGGVVHEGSEVLALEPGIARTAHGSVRARHVVRATEGYTAGLPGYRREVAPVYSMMIATEPLPEQVWATIGLAERPTFNDLRHLIIYGQRTADGRLAFGGRGAPYHFGSAVRPEFDQHQDVFSALRATLVELFPAVADAAITHRWGGPLGIARDWSASVGVDASTGVGWAGGYVGDGVGTSNLAGRTLADLILGRDTDLLRLPWVGHRSRPWEPEPLRWTGVNAGLRAMTLADQEERRTGRPSRIARTFARLIG